MGEQDLKDELASAATPADFLAQAWEQSTKNAVARGVMAGMLDGLRYAKAISVVEYSAGYDRYVLGHG